MFLTKLFEIGSEMVQFWNPSWSVGIVSYWLISTNIYVSDIFFWSAEVRLLEIDDDVIKLLLLNKNRFKVELYLE